MNSGSWIQIAAGTHALEIPNAGCLVKKDVAMCFVPNVLIEKVTLGGKLVGTRTCEARVTMTGSAAPMPATSVWVGTAGDKLNATLKERDAAREKLAALNKYIQQTWKITPNAKQLSALLALISGR